MAADMIHRFQCLSCGAVYQDQDAGGCSYAHVCGPLPADKDGVSARRPDARDENPTPMGISNAYEMRSEGLGVKCLSNPKLVEPEWIARMKLTAAKLEEEEA